MLCNKKLFNHILCVYADNLYDHDNPSTVWISDGNNQMIIVVDIKINRIIEWIIRMIFIAYTGFKNK